MKKIKDFYIDTNQIPISDIKSTLSCISPRKKVAIEKSFDVKVYDFLLLLYVFRFVDKLSINEISVITKKSNNEIYKTLYDLRWHYSANYETNQSEHEKTEKVLLNKLIEAKQKVKEEENIPIIVPTKSISKRTYQAIGFETEEDYKNVMWYLHDRMNLSRKDLAIVFGISTTSIRDKLKSLGLLKNHSEGIERKKNRGSQNYVETAIQRNETRTKTIFDSLDPNASKDQEYIRRKISTLIRHYIDISKYEVVVGISNTGILGSLEIDIPIIVYSPKENLIFRFAIEYNPRFYHSEDRDGKKKSITEERGWIYIQIIPPDGGQYSNNSNLIDIRIRTICEEIKEYVELN